MIKIETVKTADCAMDYFRFGRGDKTAVILPGISVQSVMKSADAVADAFSSMQEEFCFYVFDRRKELPPQYSIYEMAKDTAAAIRQVGLSDLYLFGASQGGMIAMTLTIENPDLVKKLALASTSSHITQEQYAALQEWVELAQKGDREGLYLRFGEMIYPPEVFAQYRDYFIDVSRTVTDEELQRFIILASGTKDFDVSDRLQKITCPVLTTGSFEDAVLDSDATMEIAEKLEYNKDFHLYMYTGFGHAAFDTAPDFRRRMYVFFID